MSETGTSNEGQRKKHLACAAAEERREHLTSKPTFITAKPTEPSQVPHSRQTSWWRQGVRWQLCCLRCIAGQRSKSTKRRQNLRKRMASDTEERKHEKKQERAMMGRTEGKRDHARRTNCSAMRNKAWDQGPNCKSGVLAFNLSCLGQRATVMACDNQK